ncbi:MAG: DHH family phosphoesterase [Granulosicoccaceae bacterium]
MTHFDVFNGDADGICALHQLRLTNPIESTLITGVKRDINLLKQIDPSTAASVTTLDVSMEKNIQALLALLDAGVDVEYFDHHFPDDIPEHKQLSAHIDTDANTCTGMIVNQHLNGAHLAWAVTAAFGDNLYTTAEDAAKPLGLGAEKLEQLKTLGTLLNYNGYGNSLEDLYFPPADLYQRVMPYANPLEFIENDDAFAALADGYAEDMKKAAQTQPLIAEDNAAVIVFPMEAFARRVSGVYANQLAQQHPDRAHALLSALPGDGFLVSVRAPMNNKTGADDLVRQFETGGGRKAAAGINFLPEADVDRFCDALRKQYS